MTDHLKPTTESSLKRLAKQLKSEQGLSHAEALDAASRQAGYSNYRHAKKSIKPAIDELEMAVREAMGYEYGYDKIIDLVAAPDRSHWYAAVESEGRVSALLIITELRDDLSYRIKTIPEEAGPFGLLAPVWLLDKLSPTDSEVAQDWRQACRDIASGKEVMDPYIAFTHKGDLIPGSPEAVEDALERKAYKDGMEARLAGMQIGEFPDQETTACDMLFMDGWLRMDSQLEVQELMSTVNTPTMH